MGNEDGSGMRRWHDQRVGTTGPGGTGGAGAVATDDSVALWCEFRFMSEDGSGSSRL